MQDEALRRQRVFPPQAESANFQRDNTTTCEDEQERTESTDARECRGEDTAASFLSTSQHARDGGGRDGQDEEAPRHVHLPDEQPASPIGRDHPSERASSHREPRTMRESAESPVAKRPPSSGTTLSGFMTELYTFSYLVFFSIFGALARIGLAALTFYPGAPVTTGVLWANVGGALLTGFFGEDRKLFREEWGQEKQSQKTHEGSGRGTDVSAQGDEEVLNPGEARERHKAIKKSIPLYIGLTLGFCASFTSFSNVMLDAFLALTNDLPNPNTSHIAPRNGGYSFMAVVAIIGYTTALSHAGFVLGVHLAAGIDKYTPTLPFAFTRKILDPTFVVLGVGCWLGSIFLALWPPDRHLGNDEFWRGRAVFAVVFAPLGSLLRYYVSLLLNPRVPTFPLGTFAANIFGTMILGMCFDLQHAASVVGMDRLTGCQVLNGIMQGFCGCLTTVSTWIAELVTLDTRHAYLYWCATVALGLSMQVVIIGSMGWTVGLDNPVC